MVLNISAALVILICGSIIAWRNRGELQKMSLTMTLAITLAVTVLTLPYYSAHSRNLFYAVLSAFRYGTSVLSLSVDEAVIYEMENQPLFSLYMALLSILYVLGPLFASIFLIGFSRSVVDYLRLGRFANVHVFSELNERSATIAQSLYERNPKELRIFCASKNAPDSLKAKAIRSHSFLIDRDESNMPLRKRHSYEFYEIFDDPEQTLPRTGALLKALEKKAHPNCSIRAFASHEQIELMREFDAKLARDSSAVRIRYIDESSAEAVELFRYMIPRLPIGIPDYHYQFLLIGCGSTGSRVLRVASSLMILPDSHYTFHVVDRNAGKLVRRFKGHAPEFFNAPAAAYLSDDPAGKNYDVVFHEIDADSSQLDDLLLKIGRPDLTVIALPDDLTNHRLAKQVQRTVSSLSPDLKPAEIAVRFRANPSLSLLEPDSSIYYFGNLEYVYNYSNLIHPGLEEAARQVHMAYYNTDQWTSDMEETFYYFVNNDSSFDQALSMLLKRRYILSQKPEGRSDAKWIDTALHDDEMMKKLAITEHDRWNAYQRINGWRRASLDQVRTIAERTGGKKVKDDQLLLHPAIVPYELLEETEKQVDAIRRSFKPDAAPVNYVASDYNIIRALPKILRSEQNNDQ